MIHRLEDDYFGLPQRIIVCGPRDWSDEEFIYDALHLCWPIGRSAVLLHGASTGVDSIAANWAYWSGVETDEFPANWKLHGRRAGPIRNTEMIKYGRATAVVAFQYLSQDLTVGTFDTVTKARQFGVYVQIVQTI